MLKMTKFIYTENHDFMIQSIKFDKIHTSYLSNKIEGGELPDGPIIFSTFYS